MSVLIRDMEMPTNCYKCPLRQRNGMEIVCHVAHERFSVGDVNILEYRLDNCPLVPVPPHGRLIDADALIESFDPSDFWNPDAEDNCFAAVHVVNTAPTIIPAEEGE